MGYLISPTSDHHQFAGFGGSGDSDKPLKSPLPGADAIRKACGRQSINLIPWCWPIYREDEAGDPIHLAELEEHEEWCHCEDPEAPGCPCPCEDCDPPHEEGVKDKEVRRLTNKEFEGQTYEEMMMDTQDFVERCRKLRQGEYEYTPEKLSLLGWVAGIIGIIGFCYLILAWHLFRVNW